MGVIDVIRKAITWMRNAPTGSATGVVTNYVPFAPPEYGQPRSTGYHDVTGYITTERMRELALTTPTVAACVNTIVDYTTGVDYRIEHKEPSHNVPTADIQTILSFLKEPNPRDSEAAFMNKLVRDLVVLGYAAIEIERNAYGTVANLWPVDAGRLKIDYDKHGNILGYDMLDVVGTPIKGPDGVHAYLTKDIIYITRDSSSDSEYAPSRVAQLFSMGVLEQLMMQFIGARFTDSNIPYGILSLGPLSDDDLKQAQQMWDAQMQKLGHSRLLLTASADGKMDYISFAGQLKDLDATHLLLQVRSYIMAILGVTVNELGEAADVNKANGFNLSFTFKKRAIEPILRAVSTALTTQLINKELGFPSLRIIYNEIDSRDELIEAQIDDLRMKSGILSINEVRNRKGMVSVDGGEEPYIILGASVVPVSMLKAFADAQLDALQGEVTLMKTQIQQAKQAMTQQQQQQPQLPNVATPPMVRQSQLPLRGTTPDGAGSSSVKLMLPKPKLAPTPAKTGTNNTKPKQGTVKLSKQIGNTEHGKQ